MTEPRASADTAYIVKNVAVLRTEAGLTIDQFAKRCGELVGDPARFKPNTMQGLFAGKRKNITYDELAVFARVLNVPVTQLLPPTAALLVEDPGGRPMTEGRDARIGRRDHVAGVIAAAIDASGMSQGAVARRMNSRGWETYSQMTVSRIVNGERSVPVEEYAGLMSFLPLPPVGFDSWHVDQTELNELRAFKRRVLEAIGGECPAGADK